MAELLAVSHATGHRIENIGLIICCLGALVLTATGVLGYSNIRRQGHTLPVERLWLAIAGAILLVGFVIDGIGVHFAGI